MNKYIENINNILDNWLYDNDFEVSVFYDTDFAYYYNDDTISYSFITIEKNDKVFLQTCKELGLIDDFNIFLISLFHEIGHYMTLDNIDDNIYKQVLKEKEKLEQKQDFDENDLYFYQHLEDEIIATKWAVDYLNNNEMQVKELWNKIAPHIKNFYKSIDK